MKTWTRKVLIAVCLVAGLLPARGQSGFNKLISFDGSAGLNLDDILWDDGGIVVRGNIYVDSLKKWGLFLCRLDTNGILEWRNTIMDAAGEDDIISNTPTRFIKTSDGGFLLPVSFFFRNNFGLIKTDQTGKVEFISEYHNEEKTIIPNYLTEYDGNFYVSGYHARNTPDLDYFVLKADSIGKMIWLKHYGAPELSELSAGIINLSNKFAIGGLIEPINIFDLPIEDRWFQPWILYIDTSGAIVDEWKGEPNDQRTKSAGGLVHTNKGDWISLYNEFKEIAVNTIVGRPAISKMDSSYILVWKKEFGEFNSHFNSFYDVAYDSLSNDIIVAGQLGIDSHLKGCLIKFSESGDILWEVFTNKIVNPDALHWLGGLCISPTGSVYAAGYIDYDSLAHSSFGWILKVTPDGCVDTLCTTTSILDQIHQKENIAVYPNPLTNILIIDWKNGPPDHSFLYGYDSTGILCMRHEITNGLQTFDLSNLPPGPLLYKIQSGNLVLKSGVLMKI